MGFYDNEKNIKMYLQMAEGYDGKELIEILKKHLPEGSSLLELGMGPGKDLEMLSKYYKTTGSDLSEVFIKNYLEKHPDSDIIQLDALSLKTDRKFDGIYSNKVLHHLSYEQIESSLSRQSELLSPKGILFHSFWYGQDIEDFDGLMFYQLTEEKLKSLIPQNLDLVELVRYTEMEEMDSIYGIFQLKN